MRTCKTNSQLRRAVGEARRKGHKVALVPTMGHLHEGHLALVRRARESCEHIVVSIFVNPLQFGPNEDLDTYPRTFAADQEKLLAEGVQTLYAPTVEELYPDGVDAEARVEVPEMANTLCGLDRPLHFTGVATVVTKLFNLVQPDVAVFGEKDFQQLCIIRKLTRDLCLPVEIVGVPTQRAADGLALSSRNTRLEPGQRRIAPLMNQALRQCRDAIAGGDDNYRELEAQGRLALQEAGFKPDYFEIRDAGTLGPVTDTTAEIAILAAARLGTQRLIDNVRIGRGAADGAALLSSG